MNIYKEHYEHAEKLYTCLEFLRGKIAKEDLQNCYKNGMLRLKNLQLGHIYLGKCRNGFMAQWNGQDFVLPRWEMTVWTFDFVPHPEHDRGYDIFVPVFDVTNHINTQLFGE